jgi:hypothetical protein
VQGREDYIIRLFPVVYENDARREADFSDEVDHSGNDGRADSDNVALVIQLLLCLADCLSYRGG